MTGSPAARTSRRKASGADKKSGGERLFDRELEALPPDLRWREWMLRIEAVIFAAAEPVTRETLARVVGKDCSIDLLIDDLQQELTGRPYEIVPVAGGWQHRSRPAYALLQSRRLARAGRGRKKKRPRSASQTHFAVSAPGHP